LVKKLIKKFYYRLKLVHYILFKSNFFFKKSYSCFGEDLVVARFFKNKANGFFVDVGCYHPFKGNNTYLLYKKGWSGLNIDPSEASIEFFKFLRSRDINVCKAVSCKQGISKFYYQKELSFLSTLKKQVAKLRFQGIIKERNVETDTLDNILNKSKYNSKKIDFLNIDTEGNDYEVIQSLNFRIYSPKLICVEDLVLNKSYLDSKVCKLILKKGYRHIWSNAFSHIFSKI